MLHAVIMAGGSGTRFWPESRAARPKQLLPLVGEQTMIQTTVARLGDAVPSERTLILTNARLAADIAAQLPALPAESIVAEPCRRDTAPAIGLAAFHVSRDDPQAIMLVMPSDHVIHDADAFRRAIRHAAALVEQAPQRIVTFGIRPTYPAESFGYIERGEPLESAGLPPSSLAQTAPPTFRVAQFREKPRADVARQYVESGRFYWNAGIFVWRASTILTALEQHQPLMYERLRAIAGAWGTANYPAVLEREFAAIDPISVDYAVMEHARDVVVVEAPFDWDDVGSWQAIARLQGTDAEGNTLCGKHLGWNTRGTLVRTSADHLVVTLGVSDCIVVHTPDATLVANKHDEESIRKLVKMMEERGWTEYL